jgi:hypothetical protein
MDTALFTPDGNGLLREWVEALRAAAEGVGLCRDVMPIRGWLGGAMLVACVRRLGGTVEPLEPFYGWTLQGKAGEDDLPELRDWAPELDGGGVGLRDFHGVVAIRFGDATFVALRTDEPVTHHHCERVLVLAGPSREATLRLAARLADVRRELLGSRRVAVFGTRRKLIDVTPVEERDLILPDAFKRDLLAFFDGFGRAARICGQMRLSPSRGVLMVGAPGTGKTQTVRHLFARLADARFYVLSVSVVENPGMAQQQFCDLLEAVAESSRPAVVVIEDIDRLFEANYLTPQFFLNALDGLFRPRQPVLWVATSNDPRGMEQNVLDRPGRFDQVFVFPLPGVEERAALFERYAAWPIQTGVVEELARETDGLSAAHIREVCYAAALASADAPAGFADALRHQVGRVRLQHDRARNYDFALGGRKAGFA